MQLGLSQLGHLVAARRGTFRPVITPAAQEAGFTNEVGLCGTIRFLKTIAGLWVVQDAVAPGKPAGKGHL